MKKGWKQTDEPKSALWCNNHRTHACNPIIQAGSVVAMLDSCFGLAFLGLIKVNLGNIDKAGDRHSFVLGP